MTCIIIYTTVTTVLLYLAGRSQRDLDWPYKDYSTVLFSLAWPVWIVLALLALPIALPFWLGSRGTPRWRS